MQSIRSSKNSFNLTTYLSLEIFFVQNCYNYSIVLLKFWYCYCFMLHLFENICFAWFFTMLNRFFYFLMLTALNTLLCILQLALALAVKYLLYVLYFCYPLVILWLSFYYPLLSWYALPHQLNICLSFAILLPKPLLCCINFITISLTMPLTVYL